MDILGMVLRNKWFRRRAAKKGYSGNVFDNLLALMSVGKPSKPAVPTELLPMGAWFLTKGLYTLLAVQPNPDWVWPFFLERQLDPNHPDFLSRGHSLVFQNLTHRNWTAVGCVGSEEEGVVDPRGLLTPRRDGWSLDIWLRDGKKWVYPSRCDHVTQSNIHNLPFVRTQLASEGVEMDSVIFAAKVEGEDVMFRKVQLRNITASPRRAELYHALRPYNPEGLSPVMSVKIDGSAMKVDGGLAALSFERPDIMECSNEADGDVALHIDEGRGRHNAECKAGMCTAAAGFMVNLPAGGNHTYTFASPVKKPKDAKKFANAVLSSDPAFLFEETRRNWEERLAETIQIEVPDERIQNAFDINKAYLLLLWDVNAITPGPYTYHHFWFRDAAYQVSALDKIGLNNESLSVLNTYPKRQRGDGFFISQNGEWDSNGQAIWTLREHYRYNGGEEFLNRMYPAVASGARWIDRKRRSTTRNRKSPVYGLLPAGFSAEHLGPNDYFYWDDFWGIAGLQAASDMAGTLGKKEDAKIFHRMADAFLGDLEQSLRKVQERMGLPIIPASPYRRMNSGAIGSLCALYPLGLLASDDERMVNTIRAIRKESFFEQGFFQNIHHSGVNIYLTFQFAQCLMRMGDMEALELLNYALSQATPTMTWPEAVHPRTRGGVMGDGHHGWAVADYLHLVRDMLFHEEEDTLVVTRMIPPEWLLDGQKIKVRNAPSHFGRISFRVEGLTGKAAIEFDNQYHQTPRRIKIRMPRPMRYVSVDGKDAELHAKDYVDVPPKTTRVEIGFA